MCGIAGIMVAGGGAPDRMALSAMERALAHRGPDGSGVHVSGSVGFVHTRLAIIDLEGGDQPLFLNHRNRRLTLVANGEIYNHPELRAELPGYAFKTSSDCEPPLALYAEDGLNFTRRLRGMYAIALHDSALEPGTEIPGESKPERLVLARDPFGIKPLYYAETHQGFVFASEPQAILKSGLVKADLNLEARAQLLGVQFISGAECAFRGIHRVLPGETLVIEAGRIIARQRHHALPSAGPAELGRETALGQLDAAFEESVQLHQRADVPYGMFLSGGIDSSAVLAMMTRLNDRPVQTFTAGFSGTDVHDERHHAREVATALGAGFEAVEFGEGDFLNLLPKIAASMDDPVADYAILPSYKLAQLARQQGIKVILSGEGGDELFAGYGRYRRALRHWLLGGRPMRAKGTFDGLDLLREPPDDSVWRAGIAAAEDHARHQADWTPLQRLQAIDVETWLPGDLLTKLDRCLMAHGVEGRVPFIDPKLGAFAFGLPDRLKLKKGQGKWLLRAWLDQRVPNARPFSKKRGFTVPVGAWIADHGHHLGPLVAAQAGVNAICESEAVERVFADARSQSAACWTLLFYALWHRAHIEGKAPEGDILDCLSKVA